MVKEASLLNLSGNGRLGRYVVENGSLSSNRECKPCPVGRFTDENNAPECTMKSVCPAGRYQVPGTDAPDTTEDIQCRNCAEGSFQPIVGSVHFDTQKSVAVPCSQNYQPFHPVRTVRPEDFTCLVPPDEQHTYGCVVIMGQCSWACVVHPGHS